MKRILILSFLLISALCWGVRAQDVDYNTIILPSGASDISFAEKLVRLAWENNPANRILESRYRISDIQIDQARWEWLDNFRITGNINEYTINPDPDLLDRNLFFPRYNISGMVSLGYFVNIPLAVKEKKEELNITRYTIDQQKLAIRAEVLRRYEEYLKMREILKVESEAQEDLFSALSLVEQNFRNGSATIEEYNGALEKYNNQRIRKITAQGDFNMAKISVEELIGVRLEDVK
ncbi:TolC family protein [Fulvivirga sedimenti]|uniref:TolC family protein n=1 Tax=Fulvivirga sedimenti TaxID=2879465 RepID=A0A9X1L1F0_9BACT|nr:TolC family protein [Fulvivirga sedimenti]MCA6078769.1 TolC family protein [Fulvivirga sedimenti]